MIELTEDERAMWAAIEAFWRDRPALGFEHDRWGKEGIGQKQRALAESLIARKAVPRGRLSYFVEPECNIGSARSRYQMMVENGGRHGDPHAVFEHPHFYGHLRYWIGFIELPDPIQRSFRSDALNERTSSAGYNLGTKYRSIARSAGLTRRAADEFFKLALDCGYEPGRCRAVRDIIRRSLPADR